MCVCGGGGGGREGDFTITGTLECALETPTWFPKSRMYCHANHRRTSIFTGQARKNILIGQNIYQTACCLATNI